MTFISFYNYQNTQFVMNISKFQFQIYRTSRFLLRPILHRDSVVLVLGWFGLQFFFRDSNKDWLGNYKILKQKAGEA